jgi:hypothetical protein
MGALGTAGGEGEAKSSMPATGNTPSAATKRGWRPDYWDDLGDDWTYRICASVGLGCAIGVVGMFLVLVIAGVVKVLR